MVIRMQPVYDHLVVVRLRPLIYRDGRVNGSARGQTVDDAKGERFRYSTRVL